MPDVPEEVEAASSDAGAKEAQETDEVASEDIVLSIAPDEPEEAPARPPPLPRAALRAPPLPAGARRRGPVTLPAIDEIETASLDEEPRDLERERRDAARRDAARREATRPDEAEASHEATADDASGDATVHGATAGDDARSEETGAPDGAVAAPMETWEDRLRAELANTTDGAREARLRTAIAEHEEAAGARDEAADGYRAAFEADPLFRESVEGTLRLAEAGVARADRDAAVDALVATAETANERARAWTERAFTLEDGATGDVAAVHDAARAATEETDASEADRGPAWLVRERAAAKLADPNARREALVGRIEHAREPTWRGLLLVDLARLTERQDDVDEALRLLERARAEGPAVTWLTLETADAWLRAKAGDPATAARLARVLDERATRIAASLADPEAGDAAGIPKHVRTAAHVVHAWIEQSRLERRAGNDDGEAAALERARTFLASAPARDDGATVSMLARVVSSLRRQAAAKTGDSALAAKLAADALATTSDGPSRAALAVRIAEHALDRGDDDALLEALTTATRADPASAQAWAGLVDFLAGAGRSAPLAETFEALAARFEGAEARGRALVVAAYVWAVQASDADRGRRALERAVESGFDAAVGARIGRALAAVGGDAAANRAWYVSATEALVAALEKAEAERHAEEIVALWVELARHHLVHGDEAGFARATAALRGRAEGAWLGHVLEAFGTPSGVDEGADDAVEADAGEDAELATALLEDVPRTTGREDLDAGRAAKDEARRRARAAIDPLIAMESDPGRRRTLRVAAALRDHDALDTARALATLRELFDEDPSDPLVASYLAELLRAGGDDDGAARVATALAEAHAGDAAFSGARLLEAGFARWKSGDRAAALASFERAEALVPRAAEAAVAWAARGGANGVDARRHALLLEEHLAGEDAATALERFALEATAGEREEAAIALAKAEATIDPGLRMAAAMARMAWGASDEDRSAWNDAVRTLFDAGDAGARAAAAEAVRIARQEAGRSADDAVAAAAKAWGDVGGAATAALEWLGADAVRGDVDGEIAARRRLSEFFSGDGREELIASAALLEAIHRPESPPELLEGPAAATRLANLEFAPAGSAPERRAHALASVGDALGEDARTDALGLAGWARLAVDDAAGALDAFREVTRAKPDEVHAWEGVRTAAETLGEQELVAMACEELGARSSNRARGAAFLEHAGLLWLALAGDDPAIAERGEIALDACLRRDPRRPVAFDKLFRRARDRNDGDTVLRLARKRLEITDDPAEIAKLYWEIARALRAKGDVDGALEALEHVTLFDEEHVGALALTGEIFIRRGKFGEAAERLSRLALLRGAPPKNRITAGVAAVDLYENKLGEHERALAILLALHREKLTTLPLRERIARAAAKTGAWDEATKILEELMVERTEASGRVEAARLAMVVHRDRLGAPARAVGAVTKLLDEAPTDGEALDFVVALEGSVRERPALLERGRDALLEALHGSPEDRDGLARLARIASALGDAALERAVLGCLRALGPDPDADEAFAALADLRARLPESAPPRAVLAEIAAPNDGGPLAELFAELGPTLAEAFGPSLATLGVHPKKDRVDPRSGLLLHREIATWMEAFGVAAFELYVGGKDPEGVHGVAGETPSIVVGPHVRAPLSPIACARVAREIFALLRGTTTLRARGVTAAAIAAAACKVTKSPAVAWGDPPADVERALSKAIARKTKARVEPTCRALAKASVDPAAWEIGARLAAERAAVVACGDVALVLADPNAFGGAPRPANVESVRELLRFVLSRRYVELRRAFGLEG